MGDIFLKILNMSISASWLILAVVFIRLVFRKAPKWSMCLLWGLVAVKLVVPFSPESVLSFIPSNEVIPESIATETHPHINSGITYIDMTINPVMESNLSPQIGDSVNPLQVIIYIAGIVWCVGIIICLAYALVSYIILKRKVRASKLLRKGVYACDEVKSPFILGLFRPVIYIPSGMKDEVMEYVIAHENAHLKRGDHFWKPLGFIILSVYWFNPLCWVAYNLLCRDIEYACDEKVICDKDREYVNLYSQALLDCNAQRRIIAACPLAFGETDVKGRIKGILNYKKPAFWVIIASLIICIVVAICFMTKQKQEEPGRIPPELIVRIEGSNEGVSATVRSYTWAEDSIGNDEVMSLEDLHPEMDHSVTDLKFDVENVRLVLEFAEEPDEVLVRCWDEKYVDEGGDLGEGFTEISYNAETHTIDIPGFRSLYYTVRASWENRGGASYAFLINRGDAAELNEENTELYVSMQVIDDEHADFLFEAFDGSLSEAEYLENLWLYFSGDYSRYVLEMLIDPKDGQENAFMYDSLENVAVGVVTIDKMENGIILHADMSAAESWEGVSFSNLKSYELRYRMSTGEEYSRLIDLSESSNPEGFNDADNLESYDPGIYVDSYSVSPIGSSPAQMTDDSSNDISDWISSINLPDGYGFSGFSEFTGYQGGFYILPRIYECDENTGVSMEWQCSGMLTRVSSNYPQADITFYNGCPNLSGVPYHNHTYAKYIMARGVNVFDETKWPFIALFEAHDLYTMSELEDMKQAGVDINEIDRSSDYWYFWFVKEGADTYYILSLSAKEFSKEQAMEIAESVCIAE
jgi:beta-lactamase regulating signal transducer with metallopeptidase domain